MADLAYGLWPIAVDRLLARTGKVYSFAAATVLASSPGEARKLAKEQDTNGLEWDDSDIFQCAPVAMIGNPPPKGTVFYQWVLAD